MSPIMIGRYKRIGEVTAVQFNGENQQEIESFSEGIFKRTDDAGMLLLKVKSNAHIMKKGTWIIRTEIGRIESATDAAFTELYEKI